MKINIYILLIVTIGLILSSCSPRMTEPPTNQQSEEVLAAQDSLVAFLDDLHEGRYEDAARLYGGTYDIMIDHNPNLDPNDRAGLLRNACTINGAECLELKSVVLEKEATANEFDFKVEFMDEDGSLFVLGPCCGGNETDTPQQSVFTIKVIKKDDGDFVVMEMPPYVP